jgi:hypothetical protein
MTLQPCGVLTTSALQKRALAENVAEVEIWVLSIFDSCTLGLAHNVALAQVARSKLVSLDR